MFVKTMTFRVQYYHKTINSQVADNDTTILINTVLWLVLVASGVDHQYERRS